MVRHISKIQLDHIAQLVLFPATIVRFYETRQGGKAGKPGAYTTKEAQLIGHGARCFWFVLENKSVDRDQEDKFIRKYDQDHDSPNRLLDIIPSRTRSTLPSFTSRYVKLAYFLMKLPKSPTDSNRRPSRQTSTITR